MEKLPKVSVIVLNYNGKDTIRACLDSVYKSDYGNYELVVIDNSSKDGSFELAKKLFSRAHFILNSENVGFAVGNNIAIRFALEKMADYVFLLNNDAIIENDTLSKLVAEAEKDKKTGIASPVIKGSAGKIWFAGGRIDWLKMKARHEFEIKNEKPYETEYVTGCAMLIKKDVFRDVGLFDENYFLYYEDADFCLRAGKKGFNIKVNPEASIYHFEKSETYLESKTYWLVLSGLIFFKKNTPAIFRQWMNFYLILRRIKNWRDVVFNKNELAGTTQKAYKDFKKLGI